MFVFYLVYDHGLINYVDREILMTASPNIKTPSMDVPLTNGQDNRHQGERLKRLFTRVCLSEVCGRGMWA